LAAQYHEPLLLCERQIERLSQHARCRVALRVLSVQFCGVRARLLLLPRRAASKEHNRRSPAHRSLNLAYRLSSLWRVSRMGAGRGLIPLEKHLRSLSLSSGSYGAVSPGAIGPLIVSGTSTNGCLELWARRKRSWKSLVTAWRKPRRMRRWRPEGELGRACSAPVPSVSPKIAGYNDEGQIPPRYCFITLANSFSVLVVRHVTNQREFKSGALNSPFRWNSDATRRNKRNSTRQSGTGFSSICQRTFHGLASLSLIFASSAGTR